MKHPAQNWHTEAVNPKFSLQKGLGWTHLKTCLSLLLQGEPPLTQAAVAPGREGGGHWSRSQFRLWSWFCSESLSLPEPRCVWLCSSLHCWV